MYLEQASVEKISTNMQLYKSDYLSGQCSEIEHDILSGNIQSISDYPTSNLYTERYGFNLLYLAIMTLNQELILELLECGLDIIAEPENGISPLATGYSFQ